MKLLGVAAATDWIILTFIESEAAAKDMSGRRKRREKEWRRKLCMNEEQWWQMELTASSAAIEG